MAKRSFHGSRIAFDGIFELEHLERGHDGHLLGGADFHCSICRADDPDAAARRLWPQLRERVLTEHHGTAKPWGARFDSPTKGD